MKEAPGSSETSVLPRRNNPEDTILLRDTRRTRALSSVINYGLLTIDILLLYYIARTYKNIFIITQLFYFRF
jgi:hypothetical protein